MSKIALSDIEKQTIAQCLNDGSEIPLEIVKKIAPGFFDKLAQEGKFDYRNLNKYKIPVLDYEGKRSEPAILASAALLGESSPLQILRCFDGKDFKHNGDTQEEIFDILEKQKRGEDDWRNLIIRGDNLLFLKTCYLNQDPLIKHKVKGKVKLVYIDPPFGVGEDFGGAGGEMSYSAKLAGAEFIEAIRERLVLSRELMHETGLVFFRIDYHFAHYVKVALDDVFGKENHVNNVLIGRKREGAGTRGKLDVTHEYILIYSKTKNFSFNDVKTKRSLTDIKWTSFLMAGNRYPRERTFMGITLVPPEGQHFSLIQDKCDKLVQENFIRLRCRSCGARFYYAYSEGDLNKRMKHKNHKFKFYDITSDTNYYHAQTLEKCLECGATNFAVDYLGSDNAKLNDNWLDIESYASSTGYPTENSESLLERIVMLSLSDNDNELVLDIFGGSGTTGVVAEKCGKKWIMCDFGKHSIYIMQKRLLTIANSKKLSADESKGKHHGKNACAFAIASVGSFDFSRIVNLRKHKEVYINFILTLFNIQERSPDELEKYKLPNIYGLRDGDPVEIYPIWEDDYLKSIKIDKDYLKGLAEAEGGKLKGTYYIIAPEICDVVGDWDYKTSQGNVVSFRIMSYPYKILEEISRSQQLSEQPGSSSEINKLISSTRFYFNQDVTCKLAWHPQGLKITDLETAITDKFGKEIQGLDAMAMVLVDKDYDGKMFTMEEAVYRKDIKDDGIIPVAKLTDKVAVIVIDRHGNESKIMILGK